LFVLKGARDFMDEVLSPFVFIRVEIVGRLRVQFLLKGPQIIRLLSKQITLNLNMNKLSAKQSHITKGNIMKNNKITNKKSLIYMAVIANLSASSLTYAAEEVTEEKATNAVEIIQVTARRKTETILEIPMAISSISAMEIADRNYTQAEDLYRTLAGAAMPGDELILRGLSGGNSDSPGTTATFVDDIPFEFTNLSDIERVEVLRGPQGTLYGSNAIGGTVRIITKKPKLDEFELFGSVVGGSEKDVAGYDSNISLGLNIPLMDNTLALRVNGNIEHDQKQYVNMNTGVQSNEDNSFIRSQLLWQISDGIDMTLGYSNVKSAARGKTQGDRSQPEYYYDYALTDNPDAFHGYDVDFFTVDCPQGAERPECRMGTAPIALNGVPKKFQIWEAMDPWSEEETDLFTLNLNVDNLMDFASLAYAGSYRKVEEASLHDWTRLDGTDMYQTWIINDWPEERTTHELRLQNFDTASPLAWTLGVFYDRSEQSNVPNYQVQYHAGDDISLSVFEQWMETGEDMAAYGQDLFGNRQEHWQSSIIESWDEELSFFADVSYLFDLGNAGDLEVNGGIRNYHISDKEVTSSLGLWGTSDDELSGKESGNRYKFSLSYRPADDLSAYALYSEGYRPGGNNAPLTGACLTDPKAGDYTERYESDQVQNYEIGVKGLAFDNRFNYAVAAYQINWTDMLTDVYMDECGFSYTANGGSAKTQGIEFESTMQLTDDLTMTLNFSKTDSEILEDNDAIDAKKGDDMTMVPESNAYFALDQAFSFMGKQAFVRADYTYYGEYKTHFKVKDEDIVPAYGYMNLSTRFEATDDVTISLHINNLLDDEAIKYKRSRSRSDSTIAQQYITYLAGRSVSVRLDYTFF
jgi:iron complex outermembrane receptor protein